MTTVSAPRTASPTKWLIRGLVVAFAALAIAAAGLALWPVRGNNGSATTPAAMTTEAITLTDLIPDLMRVGTGLEGSELDVIYAPRPVLGLFVEPAPDLARASGTMAFMVRENLHEGELPAQRPVVSLVFDPGTPIAAAATVAAVDDPHHRATWYVFNMTAPDGRDLSAGAKSMSLAIADLPSSGSTSLQWDLPVSLPASVTAAGKPLVAPVSLATLTRALSREVDGVSYPGGTGQVQATFATTAYVTQALGATSADRLEPDKYIVMLATETLHTADLPALEAAPALAINGGAVPYIDRVVVTEAPHHRVAAFRYVRPEGFNTGHQVMELRLVTGQRVAWHLPIAVATADSTLASGGVTWALILALMGGMVAAMWPCLFQLTAFFIPAMAGVTMKESANPVAAKRRLVVIKAALFFVLGFTIVYTLAGALIGLAAQRLGNTSSFEIWQRWMGVVGGVVIIVLALRAAAKVRAPLVCKMPVLSRMAHGERKSSRPIEMMFAGIAYATGCMTCFGSALVVGMVVYVGMAQSPLYGAGVLFLFSLGMGIPLVIGATAMARVLPLLVRMDKWVPWMGLASAVIMIGFGVLLISGNYMIVTDWAYRLAGVGR